MVNKDALAAALAGMEDNEEARAAIARLGERDIGRIDKAILSKLGSEWKKVGLVTTGVLIAAPDEYEEIPEAFYASRILALASEGRIEAQGNLEDPKAGEIRLASKPGAD